jgi:hypothetical protein
MSELFDNLPDSKSPYLLWIEKHGIDVSGPDIDGSMKAEAIDDSDDGILRESFGCSEAEAVANLAIKCGWKLWNEEGANE